jgi:hypothetical protein
MVEAQAGETADRWARRQVEQVRDDPAARLALADRTYRGPTGDAPRHLPFRRAELAFMGWQLRRGVLDPATAARPGSPWWRACNERLLRDGCEAVARAGGLGGAPSSPAIGFWDDFVAAPSARTWYRAHNSSIVAAYLDHQELAAAENEAERFFLNVTLVRVLYAHALVAAPRLALGRLGPVSPALGDPRVRMTGLFLGLSRVLPDRYPLTRDVEFYLAQESRFARLLDYGVIGPRLQPIYEWSAAVLWEPRLCALIDRGCPRYSWRPIREVWQPAHPRADVRAVRAVLPTGTDRGTDRR